RIVIDQDVRLRTSGQQRLLTFGRRYVGDNWDHLHSREARKLGGGIFQLFSVSSVDDHFAARFCQGARAGVAKAAARCANNGLAAGISEFHGFSFLSTGVLGPYTSRAPSGASGRHKPFMTWRVSLFCSNRLIPDRGRQLDSGGHLCCTILTGT